MKFQPKIITYVYGYTHAIVIVLMKQYIYQHTEILLGPFYIK